MTLVLNGTTGVSAVDGSASTPAFQGNDTNTGVFFPAADRIGFSTNGVQRGEFDSSGNFQFNSGYGSVATAYGCRAWVNFNGTGTVAIRASGNVTSITDNGTGDYTVNFTTAMPDASYSITGTASRAGTSGQASAGVTVTPNDVVTARTTSACRIILLANGGDGQYDTAVDSAQTNISIFR
jgi:hypothetical protein